MPGKVNPVLLEAAIQAGMKVMANDSLIADACSRGSLQINEFLPLVSFSLHESLELLTRIDGKLADAREGNHGRREALPLVFREEPHDRHGAAAPHRLRAGDRAFGEFFASGRENIVDFLSEKLGRELVEEALSPRKLVALGYKDGDGMTRTPKSLRLHIGLFGRTNVGQIQLPEPDCWSGRGNRVAGARDDNRRRGKGHGAPSHWARRLPGHRGGGRRFGARRAASREDQEDLRPLRRDRHRPGARVLDRPSRRRSWRRQRGERRPVILVVNKIDLAEAIG